ncbi:MAG: helix-turn-helix transcriptional regulator [Bacillota bacterium]
MDLHECPCSGKTLARLVQPAVMAVLADQPLHGYVIVQRLAEIRIFRGQSPDPTGVYRVLKAMEQEGLVESTWELADRGPAKRCFALTSAGRVCLTSWGQTLQEYQQSIADLLAVISQAMRPKRSTSEKRTRRTPRCSPATGCCGNVSRS